MRRNRLSAFAATLAVTLLGGAPTVAGATVSTGQSGWSWSNPAPQGESIADVAFAGSTGYAVGGFGTLLRSTDAGATWTGLASGSVQDLTRVSLIGPSGFVTSGSCAVRRSTDTGTTLSRIDVGGGDTGCGTTVVAVAFADASNGLILFQNGVVLATADGGVSLARRTPVPGVPSGLVSVNATTAFAISGNSVYRTVDSGGSWTLVALATRNLRAMTFPTATVGYAVGDGGVVLKTINGGANWLPAAPAPGGDLARAGCANESLCLFTTVAGSIVRTTDGGLTYSLVTAAATPIRAVSFASATRAVGVGDSGTTVLSDDGGATWRTTSSTPLGDAAAIAARAGGFAYAVGPTAISLTSDGGESWRSVGIPTPRAIDVAAFAGPLVGFVRDDGGTLRRTVDGGVSWQILDPGLASGPLQEIVALSTTKVLLVTSRGVARSVNGGDDFTVVSSPVLARSKVIRRGILAATGSGRRALIVGRAGLLVSTDAGATWKARAVPRVRGRIPAIAAADCIAPATCWVVTAGSRAYRTTTLGARWDDVTPGLGIPLRNVTGIAAAGPKQALISLRTTPTPSEPLFDVLESSDAGKTWAPQRIARLSPISIDAVAGRAWTLAAGGQIFTTSTGGRTPVPSTLTIAASPRAITGPTTITIKGKLARAGGGEQVALYATGFTPRVLTVASSGSFTATFRVKKPTTFVAQWAGDGVRSGDGTPALVVSRR